MPMFRKKPVEIEAVQWNGEEIIGGSPEWLATSAVEVADAPTEVDQDKTVFAGDKVYIGTREGVLTASPGDWIIKGTAGELYPCKAAVFADIYELVTIGKTELSGGAHD